MRKFYLMTLLLATVATAPASACTNFLFTRGTTKDGSTMVTYAADSHVLYGELYHWPAAKWPAGSMLDIYEWDTGKFMGKIPQAEQTYNVVGNMNEHQLSIAETTYGGRPELVRTGRRHHGLREFDIRDLAAGEERTRGDCRHDRPRGEIRLRQLRRIFLHHRP